MRIHSVNKPDNHIRSIAITTILLIILLFTGNCYSQNINTARWWDKNFNNTVKSLPLPDFLYNSDNRIFYIIGNDQDSLFICLKIPDEFQQHEILHGGITLWIDLNDKKNKELGIRFPVGNVQQKHPKDEELSTDVNYRRNQLIEQLNEIELIGFKEDQDRYIIPCNNPVEIHATIDYDMNGYLFYKLVVPFNKIPDSTFNSDKLFSIGIETSGQKDSGQNREVQGDERKHPGGRGSRAGGMENGYNGETSGHREMNSERSGEDIDSDHSGSMQQTFTSIHFWIKRIKLASQ